MSGRIKSEAEKIWIYPPNQSVSYIIELEPTNHVRVWVEMDGKKYSTSYIPFEVIPYLSILMHRRRITEKEILARISSFRKITSIAKSSTI